MDLDVTSLLEAALQQGIGLRCTFIFFSEC